MRDGLHCFVGVRDCPCTMCLICACTTHVLPLQDLCYQGVLDTTLRNCFAGSLNVPSPGTLMDHTPFKTRWDDAIAKATGDSAAAIVSTATTNLEKDADTASDNIPLPDPIASANPAQFAMHSYDYWLATASQILKTYIKLVPEVSTVSGVATLADHCTENGIDGKRCVLIMYDSDLQGE